MGYKGALAGDQVFRGLPLQILAIPSMNKNACLAALVIFSATALMSHAQDKAFEISAIEPEVVKTPNYNFSLGPRNSRTDEQDWVQVEVTFAAAPEFTDELTMKYYIAINKQVLTGEVTHINVPAGRELRSVMYVPPRTVQRLTGGKNLTPNAFDNIGVQLLVKGQLVAQMSWKKAGNENWFQTVQQIPNLVLNKNETPFAPLFWDRYEMIKSASR